MAFLRAAAFRWWIRQGSGQAAAEARAKRAIKVARRHAKDLNFEIKPPLKEVLKSFQRAERQMRNFGHPHQQASIFLDRWVQENFKGEGEKVGGWMPLKAGGRRMRGGGIDPSAKILQNTGRLRGSFEPFWSPRNAGIRSDLEYAPAHEKGLGPIPQRRMLPKHKEVKKEIRAIFAAHTHKSLEPLRHLGRRGR